MIPPWIRPLFYVSALYDGLLGLAFLFAPAFTFALARFPIPDTFAYVQFAAALLLIFACMFLAVALRPVANRNLIPFGVLLKVAYCSLVLYYAAQIPLAPLWLIFAGLDLLFLVLFVVAWWVIPRQPGATALEPLKK